MSWKYAISAKSGTEAAIDVCDYFTNEESSGAISGRMRKSVASRIYVSDKYSENTTVNMHH